MSDLSAEQRAQQLRGIAAVEIAKHRETEDILGAALDGSLATGAVWPTSDLDFTIVPLPETPCDHWVEWGEQKGIVWHKHLNRPQILLDLQARYPASFMDTGRDAGLLEDTWLLDGLVVMEIVFDRDGLLRDTQQFVTERRFSAEVRAGRREQWLAKLHLLRNSAETHLAKGEPEEACRLFSGGHGFGAVAAHLWLEAAHKIFSSKEQDGLLAEVTQAAGQGEVHSLYRAVLNVEPERVSACAPRLLQIGQEAQTLYQGMNTMEALTDFHALYPIMKAWLTHLAGTLALAPQRGHPAYTCQQWDNLRYWTTERPRILLKRYQEKGIDGLEILEPHLAALEHQAEQIQAALFGSVSPTERAQNSLIAADHLLRLTEQEI